MTFDRLSRDPLSVPTPVAIALADFCRRAERPASSREVRLALAVLSETEDAAFAAFCADDPAARPLSPLAAVDVFRGRPAQEAARLEQEGHYAEEASRLETLPVETAPVEAAEVTQAPPPPPLPAVEAKAPVARTRKTKAAPAGSTPLRRSREEVESRRVAEEERRAAAAEEPAAPPPRPGRKPAAPQFGRFVEGPAAKRPLRELRGDELAEMITELRSRRAILERLDATYARDERGSLAPGDLDRLLRKHGLTAAFAKAERENLRVLLRQNRGFLPPIRRALDLTAPELRKAIAAHGLEAEQREWRERLREEAQVDAPLADRLALAISREEPLRAAGALEALDASNLEHLRSALRNAAERGTSNDPVVVVELARRDLGIDQKPWRKTAAHYRLVNEAAGILGVEPPAPPEVRPASEDEGESPRADRRPRPSGGDRFGGARPERRPRAEGAERFGGDRPVRRPRAEGAERFGGPRPERRPRAEGAGRFGGPRPERRPRAEGAERFGGDRPVRRPRPEGAERFGDRPVRRPRPEGAERFGDRPVQRPRPEGAERFSGDRPVRRPRPEGAERFGGDRPVRRPRPEGAERFGGDRPVRRPRPEGAERFGGDRPVRRPRVEVSERSGPRSESGRWSGARPERPTTRPGSSSRGAPGARSGKPPAGRGPPRPRGK